MDSDKLLKAILERARRICLAGVGEESGMVSPDNVKEMAKNILRLDKGLFEGNRLPKRWQVPNAEVSPTREIVVGVSVPPQVQGPKMYLKKEDDSLHLYFDGICYKLPNKDGLTAQEVVDCLREQGLKCSVCGDGMSVELFMSLVGPSTSLKKEEA